MATETERKFLIREEFRHLAVKKLNITQFYLSIDPEKTIRIRISDSEAFLTVKNKPDKNSITRLEWEFPIPVSDAIEMMQVSLPGKVIKSRFLVPYENQMFEVDVFHDKNEGLIIAEIELESEDQLVNKPEWLGEEVTGIPEYYNVNLIK
jgi:adenylate cyclase